MPASSSTSSYPSERLGLPESGPGSLATMGPRIIALLIDWGIAAGISVVWFNYDPLAIAIGFFALTTLAIVCMGSSIGHLICGMRLNTVAGQAPGVWRPILRQALLLLVVPALVVDEDGRSAHDTLSGLVLRRFR